MRELVSRFCDFYLSRPFTSAAVALVVFAVGAFFASRLSINSNQLDTLPPDLPQVEEARKVENMIGGAGFVILAFRMQERDEGDEIFYRALDLKRKSKDAEADELIKEANEIYDNLQQENAKDVTKLKTAVDEMVAELRELEEVRFIQHKVDLSSVLERILFYVKTPDLREGLRRVSKKRDDMVERASPFFIDLGQPQYSLNLNDLINKYRVVGRKEITDDYYVSPDRKMVTMICKPWFSLQEIDKTQAFVKKIRAIAKEKKFEQRGIEVGFTGGYVLYADAYDSIQESIQPTLIYALVGIAFVLLLFIRRITLIASMLIALIYAIVLTFGITYLTVGELNLITSMFGGILAGLGIDFGIHLIYRFREEYSANPDFIPAVKESILHTGRAAIYSAMTTTAAFISLILSEFRGFSDFGIISAYGIITTALCMFFLTPLILAVIVRIFPNILNKYAKSDRDHSFEDGLEHRINFPLVTRGVLIASALLVIAAAIIAPRVEWDNDVRNMLDYDIPSERLQDEIALRYDLIGSPVAIAVETKDEARALWEFFDPLTEELDQSVAQVVSVYQFVPPVHQQRENYRLIQRFRRESEIVKRSLIPQQYQQYWGQYQRVVAQRPFTFEDLPEDIKYQFRSIPESKYEGWLTFVYPEVSQLYRQEGVARLDQLIGDFEYPIVGRHSLKDLAYFVPEWERLRRTRISGSRKVEEVPGTRGVELSERDINGLLDIANRATEKELQRTGLSDLAVRTILKERPFESVADLQSHRLSAIGTGSVVIVAKFTYIILKESRNLVISTFVLVLLILFITFRNVLSSVLALVPLIAGAVIMAALMVLLGVKVNYFNVMVLPIVVGYGINNGIFVFYRYLENGSIYHTLYHTGQAALASSLTSVAGWGALAMADHPGLESMGILACVGLLSMMSATLVLFPAILAFLSEKRPQVFDTMRAKHGIELISAPGGSQ